MLLGVILRFWQFGKIPQGFQIDEASFGYNAYSILKTGKDEYGKFLPLTLRSFDDYKSAMYAYIDIPFIATLGLNEISVRLPSAILGTIIVLLTYLITKKITKKENISLITSLFCAINPVFIFDSRIQSDPTAGVFFTFLGFYCLLLWIEKKNIFFLCLTTFLWAISLFTYQFPRLFFLFFLPLVYYFFLIKSERKIKFYFAACTILLLAIIVYLVTGTAGTRYRQVSVFQSPVVRLPLEETIREDAINSVIMTRIFHNKPVAYGRFLVKSYFDHLSFNFLFFEAQSPARERVPDTGVMYIIELPFLLLGFYAIIRKKVRWGYFIVAWVLLAPAALSFIIDENPNMHRFLSTILPLQILTAYGLTEFFNSLKKRKRIYVSCLIITSFIFFYSVFYFFHELFVHQPVHQPWVRNYPYAQLIRDVDTLSPNYKKIIFPTTETNTYMYLLFYNVYDPKKYQDSGSRGNEDNGHFDKYYFSHNDCTLYTSSRLEATKGDLETLYVNRGSCQVPPNALVLKTELWGDKSIAFRVLKIIE